MQRHWSEQELEAYWSFSTDELQLIPHRDASSRLGVASALKFFQLEGHFLLRTEHPFSRHGLYGETARCRAHRDLGLRLAGSNGETVPGAPESRAGYTPRDCRRLQGRGDMAS